MLRNIFFAVVFFFFTIQAVVAQQSHEFEDDTYYRVAVQVTNSSHLHLMNEAGLAIDHVHFLDDQQTMIAELNGLELQVLIDEEIEFEVIVNDLAAHYEEKLMADPVFQQGTFGIDKSSGHPENFELGSFGGHLKLDEVYEALDEMHSQFPELITEKFSIGQSYEGREIYAVWIGTDLDEEKPQAFFNSLIHAREPNSMMALIYTMWWLLENYDEDELATFLVDNRHMAFAPVLNPDGYEFNREINPNGGGMHRKNMRSVGNIGTTGQGVDLNRNFGPALYWDHPNGGSSTFPSSQTYRGTAPFSEPETDAVREFVESHDFRTSFNYHTFSNLLIYPYGALQRETVDKEIFRAYAEEMTAENNYVYGTDIETVGYNTRGGADDYMYGYEGGNPDGRKNIISFTPEVGTWDDFFWPPASRILPLSAENLLPNQLLALYAGPELRYDVEMTPVPDLSYLQVGETNYLSFEIGELYNYGRFDAELELELTVEFEGEFELIGHVISLPVLGVDETWSGVSEPFMIEIDPWEERDQDVNLTLELRAPHMKQKLVWEYSMTTQGSSLGTGDGETPEQISLHQNYPNPFNPTTEIRFTLNENTHVALEVYDTMGRKVQTLVNEPRQRGQHRVQFDGSGLSSGVYMYRLQADNKVFVKKMTLIK